MSVLAHYTEHEDSIAEKMPAWDKLALFWQLCSRHAWSRALNHMPNPPVHVPPIQ
jgi:hypothetical protein